MKKDNEYQDLYNVVATPITIRKNSVPETKSWKYTNYYYQGINNPGTNGINATYGVDNAKIYEMLIKRNNVTNRKYWLASSCVRVDSYRADFNVRNADGTYVSCDCLWSVQNSGTENGRIPDYGVLPVVTLKSDVNYKSGDGTSSTSDKIIKFQ